MIRAVVDWEGCRHHDAAEAQRIYVTVGDRLQRVDLCPQCLATAVWRLVNRLDPDARREWVRQYVAEDTKPTRIHP